VLGRHLFALEGHHELPYWEANQRLALERAHQCSASPGSSPTPLEVGVEWHYSFGSPGPSGISVNLGPENHPEVLSQPGIYDAQGQSFYFCCVDRGAEPGAGDEGDASVHLGLDGAPLWMVHCFSSCTLSFSAEASFHQPLSSVRFYLIRDKLIDGGEVPAYKGENFNTVVFRTNVPDGGRRWDNYGSIQSTETIEWVWVLGNEYWYEEYVENADITTNRDEMAIAPDANLFNGEMPTNIIFVASLQDKTVILQSFDYSKVFIWEPNTFTQDFFNSYPNHILKTGNVYIYSEKPTNENPLAPPSNFPSIDYINAEVYFSDPLSIDSDCDGRIDGQEMFLQHFTGSTFAWYDINGHDMDCEATPSPRDYDTDLDDWSNARDLDSDNDYLADSIEANCEAWNYNPRLGKTNAYNYDTDAYRNAPCYIPGTPP